MTVISSTMIVLAALLSFAALAIPVLLLASVVVDLSRAAAASIRRQAAACVMRGSARQPQ